MIYPKRKIFAVLTFFCLNVVVASSQLTEEDIKDYDKGNYFYSLDEFKNALEFFTKLTEKYPENSKLNFKAGLCYFNIKLEEYNAIQCLEKAVKEIDSKYYESNLKGTGAPPEAWFFLGDAYHRTGQLKEASLAYHNYLYYVNKESEDYLKTIKRIGGLGISYDANLRPTGFVLENIPILNSEFSDYNPVVSGDGNTLVFTSHRNGIDKIFISSYEKGTWSKPEDITYQVGSADDFFTTAISYYGDELYLVNYDPYNSNIFVSKKEIGSWTQMKALDNFINTVDIETGASISSGGDTLYFCSNRSGGYGGVDVYYSVKRNNKWLKSVNIGNVINTPGDEGSPRISNDGNTLFFCSDGHEGIGGMDIFWSEKGIDGKWMTPARFPVPINTADDDMSFYFFDDRKSGYISKLCNKV
jgi:tetratricopeptide (TPR) repeat protein